MTQQKTGPLRPPGAHREAPRRSPPSPQSQRVLVTLTAALVVVGFVVVVASTLYGAAILIVAGVALMIFLKSAADRRGAGAVFRLPGRKHRPDAPASGASSAAPEPAQHPGGPEAQRQEPPGRGTDPRSAELQRRTLGPALPDASAPPTVPVRTPVQAPPPEGPQAALSGPPAVGPPVFGYSRAGQSPWHLPASPAVAGLAADAARLGDLEVRSASVVGPGHRCEEPADPRQDAYALGRTADGQHLILAVADGVSQSRQADLGARVAVSAATRELAKMLAGGSLAGIDSKRLYNTVAGEMIGTARNRGLTEQNVCSLLITAVIPALPQPDGRRLAWSSWIGDVSLWRHRGWHLTRITGQQKSGLDRNELTAVLPFDPGRFQEQTLYLQSGDRLIVMTDGLSESLESVPAVMDYFVRQWAGPPPHPAAFLQDLCFDAPGQSDDRTVIVTWCGAGSEAHNRSRLPNDNRPGGPHER